MYADNVRIATKQDRLAHDIDLNQINRIVAGNFEIKSAPNSTYTLLEADAFDLAYIAERVTKPRKGTIFRAQTKTMQNGGMSVLVEVNLQKGLIYFAKDNSDDDSVLEFESRGTKAKFINFIQMDKR
jgi:hypothetical protein